MDGYLIVVLVVLIAFSAFFSASETAISTINRIRIRNYAEEEGNKKAALVLRLSENYDKTLSSILVGNNIVNIAFSSLSTMMFTNWLGVSGVGVATLVATIVVLIFGEILPKSIAKEYADSLAMAIVYPLRGIMFILTPFVWLFVGIKSLILKIFKPKKKQVSVTEEELKYIIEEIEDEGVLESQESELVRSALDFDEVTVDEILTPRVDVISIEVDDPIEEIRDIFIKERFSRIPVYEGSIDNVIGILYSKDFYAAYIEKHDFQIRDILQGVILVPPKKKISELFNELQKSKSHIAIVTDEYGGNMGIVTLEDILEELVGEIWDEHDEIEHDFIKTGENTFDISGDLRVSDFLEELEKDELSHEIDTDSISMGGWALEVFGYIPQTGESFTEGPLTVTVKEAAENRIIRLSVTFSPLSDDEDDEN